MKTHLHSFTTSLRRSCVLIGWPSSPTFHWEMLILFRTWSQHSRSYSWLREHLYLFSHLLKRRNNNNLHAFINMYIITLFALECVEEPPFRIDQFRCVTILQTGCSCEQRSESPLNGFYKRCQWVKYVLIIMCSTANSLRINVRTICHFNPVFKAPYGNHHANQNLPYNYHHCM